VKIALAMRPLGKVHLDLSSDRRLVKKIKSFAAMENCFNTHWEGRNRPELTAILGEYRCAEKMR
jgi:hypothetical protein